MTRWYSLPGTATVSSFRHCYDGSRSLAAPGALNCARRRGSPAAAQCEGAAQKMAMHASHEGRFTGDEKGLFARRIPDAGPRYAGIGARTLTRYR
ncbi:hypothetical protein Mrad2831_6092 (plasmid) [Methylobacterium radiotolerans JCM 2831]|uniref:Uncharacterized protein n=1 Tax=Methylobacterium radiotolerans (strain ATCC 27329 / DSM 1819 / JCM 2831 / NBRC 15690 / NCIMB 10815 / 0-1) TaxID=426355 RepID=B1M946_METRJ|nr:hypothetical protein Mrad2831_6092 [Methylobacterium radiotolerans JCM 2831]